MANEVFTDSHAELLKRLEEKAPIQFHDVIDSDTDNDNFNSLEEKAPIQFQQHHVFPPDTPLPQIVPANHHHTSTGAQGAGRTGRSQAPKMVPFPEGCGDVPGLGGNGAGLVRAPDTAAKDGGPEGPDSGGTSCRCWRHRSSTQSHDSIFIAAVADGSADYNPVRRDSFLSSSWDDTIKLWTLDRPTSLRTFKEHAYCVYSSVWNPRHTDVFASASSDCTLRVWDVREPSSTMILPAHDFEILACDCVWDFIVAFPRRS